MAFCTLYLGGGVLTPKTPHSSYGLDNNNNYYYYYFCYYYYTCICRMAE